MTDGSSSSTDRRLADVDALLGPVADVAQEPLVLAAREVAATWEADAEAVDQAGVDRARVDVAARAGLLGAGAPAADGGGGARPAVVRTVTELLAGACGASWFVTAQHALPLGVVLAARDAPAARAHVRPLSTGTELAAVAVSHLRRPGPPAVAARRDGDGWLVDGTVGWLTAWGLADVLLLAARGGDDLVLALLPAHDLPGASSGEPLRTAAMQASRTTTLALDGLRVGPDQVVDVLPAEEWLALDTARTANVGPAAFGLLATVCRHLVRAAARPGAATAADVALDAAERGSALRQEAYGLLDGLPVAEEVPRRLRLRAETLHLLQSTSGALVAACAGGGMSLDAPAQRLAREALFHLVQAQTAPVREATLAVWAGQPGAGRS